MEARLSRNYHAVTEGTNPDFYSEHAASTSERKTLSGEKSTPSPISCHLQHYVWTHRVAGKFSVLFNKDLPR